MLDLIEKQIELLQAKSQQIDVTAEQLVKLTDSMNGLLVTYNSLKVTEQQKKDAPASVGV